MSLNLNIFRVQLSDRQLKNLRDYFNFSFINFKPFIIDDIDVERTLFLPITPETCKTTSIVTTYIFERAVFRKIPVCLLSSSSEVPSINIPEATVVFISVNNVDVSNTRCVAIFLPNITDLQPFTQFFDKFSQFPYFYIYGNQKERQEFARYFLEYYEIKE